MMNKRRVGYLIGNESEELLHRVVVNRPGVIMSLTWAIHPELAKVYPSRCHAERVVRSLDRSGLVVVPLYDEGHRWVVDWGDDGKDDSSRVAG